MTTSHTPLFRLFRIFGKIGLISFGGPAAQIALMHKTLVEEENWLSEQEFLSALSFCMLLPGPEAMQLATYSGWKLRGVLGGLIAGLLFVLPGALVILLLAVLYILYGDVPLAETALLGIQSAVIVIVLQALFKVANKALLRPSAWMIAGCAFVALYVLDLNYILIIAIAALAGSFLLSSTTDTPPPSSQRKNSWLQLPLWLALWAAPIVFVYWIDHAFLTDIALFFSKLAVVSFGGAYALLAYMTQSVSFNFGWLTPNQMIDALGLAETTPGPLILVTEFVGLLAGYAQGGWPLMFAAGALTLWCTFVPCFLWIFVAAPHVDRLMTIPSLKAALNGISAAIVGVILNLSLWFAIHVFFDAQLQTRFGLAPVFASINWTVCLLTALAALLLLGRKWSILAVLPTIMITAVAISLI